MGLLPDTYNCGFRMRLECRERFPHHRWLEIPACIMTRVRPLSDNKPMGFLGASGHIRAVMHVGVAN